MTKAFGQGQGYRPGQVKKTGQRKQVRATTKNLGKGNRVHPTRRIVYSTSFSSWIKNRSKIIKIDDDMQERPRWAKGRSWSGLGAILGRPWGRLGGVWGGFGSEFGVFWGHFNGFWSEKATKRSMRCIHMNNKNGFKRTPLSAICSQQLLRRTDAFLNKPLSVHS